MIVCGVCLNDRGQIIRLFGPTFSRFDVQHKDPIYHCGFCQEERHLRGSKVRVTTMPFKIGVEERHFDIPHISKLEVA